MSEETGSTQPPTPAPAKRLPRWAGIAILPLVALVLSGAISAINVGIGPQWATQWMQAFPLTLVVVPMALALVFLLERLAAARLQKMGAVAAGVVLSLVSGCLMESVVSFAVTARNLGFAGDFIALWGQAFLKSLPLGIAISLTMTFVVKPRLQPAG